MSCSAHTDDWIFQASFRKGIKHPLRNNTLPSVTQLENLVQLLPEPAEEETPSSLEKKVATANKPLLSRRAKFQGRISLMGEHLRIIEEEEKARAAMEVDGTVGLRYPYELVIAIVGLLLGLAASLVFSWRRYHLFIVSVTQRIVELEGRLCDFELEDFLQGCDWFGTYGLQQHCILRWRRFTGCSGSYFALNVKSFLVSTDPLFHRIRVALNYFCDFSIHQAGHLFFDNTPCKMQTLLFLLCLLHSLNPTYPIYASICDGNNMKIRGILEFELPYYCDNEKPETQHLPRIPTTYTLVTKQKPAATWKRIDMSTVD
ncbi:hypothetical protein OUZ56_018507 [Daphnia magna]|uniref:Uncharacterized protein n=1 Tax=Daphnia magna TaxID=35525 RepID=A0ABQ9Z921_9CRUS|nr:hypothetical protein OUZ56_018507 [Daphnia magna]